MKTALLFPGQASQYVGMGADLYAEYPPAREMYGRANEILGVDIAALSFHGPSDALVRTANTQPAIFLHSCVMHRLAADAGLVFDFAAGHSLGEYSALVASGVLTFHDGLVAVRERARFMQDACEAHPGTMAAVLGLDFATVDDVCKRAMTVGTVVAANYNGERQIVISGDLPGVEAASALASEAGAKRVIRLAVGGAFHSPLMEPSPRMLAPVLERLQFAPAMRPVVLNVSAEPTTDPAAIKPALIQQLTAPVLWYPTLRALSSAGVTRIIEIGPKTVLLGLAKPLFREAELLSLDTVVDLKSFAENHETVPARGD